MRLGCDAPADHVETDRDVVGADRPDHVVDLRGPFVGGRDQSLGLRLLLPGDQVAPALTEFLVEARDVFAAIARRPCAGRHVADHSGRRPR